MRCNNCSENIPDDLKYCSHCGYAIKGCTIEDFINDYFKIYAVIGVFGAISLYLGKYPTQFITENDNGIILEMASSLSLFIVVLLSINLFFKINPYIKNCLAEKEQTEKESYTTWFHSSLNVIILNLFRYISLFLFGLVALYLITFSIIGSSIQFIIYVCFLVLLMMVGIYHPAVHLLKMKKNKFIFLFIIAIVIIILLMLITLYLLDQILKLNIYYIFILLSIYIISIMTLYDCFCEYRRN
ncbi:hypothetical protein [Methanocalculus sp.]|uniref:hypothetical protein n=1 Tax=Methanocalculus sp. TaxID=2004547 RepID=UPI002613B8D3|nr:hypothetical protein [Methanocalculus sp.]